jgi:membrane associated rhomboid family serine protease
MFNTPAVFTVNHSFMEIERKRVVHSLFFPGIFLLALWLIKTAELIFSVDLGFLAIHPLHVDGLPGIVFSPLIHHDLRHLAANSVPLFVLTAILFFFYREIAYKVFFLVYFLSGLWVWLGAREAWHLGASGLIYGLASFIFFSGMLRRDIRLMALSMLVVFMYGSMVWGIFPNFMPEREISWESHLMGLVAGVVLAVYYRYQGPQRKRYDWEDEEDDEEELTEDPGQTPEHHN